MIPTKIEYDFDLEFAYVKDSYGFNRCVFNGVGGSIYVHSLTDLDKIKHIAVFRPKQQTTK